MFIWGPTFMIQKRGRKSHGTVPLHRQFINCIVNLIHCSYQDTASHRHTHTHPHTRKINLSNIKNIISILGSYNSIEKPSIKSYKHNLNPRVLQQN